jgi:hypothetical protein
MTNIIIDKAKNVINDYFKYLPLKIYLDTLNNLKTIKFHNINIHILYDSIDDIDLNHIKKVLKRAYKLTMHINKIFNIHLVLSHLKKEFNSNNPTILDKHNCNSGLTTIYLNTYVPNVDIYIIRKEEYGKVIIHEIIHHISLIHSSFKYSNIEKLKDHFKIHPIADIDPNETIVELCATIFHLNELSTENNQDLYNLFKEELKYSLYKTQQLLELQKQMKDGIWYEKSHIYCYIIFKTIIMYNISDFIKIYKFPYNDDIITDFIINHSGFLFLLSSSLPVINIRPSNSLCFMVHSDL